MIAELTPDALLRLTATLGAGGVAIVPTDTVYGLACDAHRPGAIRRMHALKGRQALRPAAVLYTSLAAATRLLETLGPRTREAAEALLPGPVTLVLPDVGARWAWAGGQGSVGLRVPDLGGALAPLQALTAPLLQTSANPTGGSDPARVQELDPVLAASVDLVLDAGSLPGRPSTVVDLRDYEAARCWDLIRAGAMPPARVARALAAVTE